jgi:hypothetical protein
MQNALRRTVRMFCACDPYHDRGQKRCEIWRCCCLRFRTLPIPLTFTNETSKTVQSGKRGTPSRPLRSLAASAADRRATHLDLCLATEAPVPGKASQQRTVHRVHSLGPLRGGPTARGCSAAWRDMLAPHASCRPHVREPYVRGRHRTCRALKLLAPTPCCRFVPVPRWIPIGRPCAHAICHVPFSVGGWHRGRPIRSNGGGGRRTEQEEEKGVNGKRH